MNLNFVNDVTGAALEAEVEPETTADEIIQQLIAEGIVTADESWQLFTPGKAKIHGARTVGEAGFSDGDRVQIMPIIQA